MGNSVQSTHPTAVCKLGYNYQEKLAIKKSVKEFKISFLFLLLEVKLFLMTYLPLFLEWLPLRRHLKINEKP